MALTDEQIQRIAHLARLRIAESEQTDYRDKLSSILDYVAQMDQVDTSGTPPMAHPLHIQQPTRPDAVTESNQREALQAIAPAVEKGLYLVPKVIE